jgi:small neutral amino acid transporter SnatA (MarC family)
VIRECAIAFVLLLIFMFFGRHFLTALVPVKLRGGAVILLLISIRMIFPHPDGVLGRTEGASLSSCRWRYRRWPGRRRWPRCCCFRARARAKCWCTWRRWQRSGVVWLAVFLSAEKLQKVLGPQVMTAFERLMGLILTAMSIEMLLGGIREFVKTL